MSHVQSVDVKVYVIEAANLENVSTSEGNQGGMKFSYWNVWQVSPLVLVKVKAIALIIAKGHASHAHIEHQVRDSTCNDNLVAARYGSVSKFTKRHVWSFNHISCILLQL